MRSILRCKNVTPHSQAPAKQIRHEIPSRHNTKSILDFLEKLNDCEERTFVLLAHKTLEKLLFAKMSRQSKKSITLTLLENGNHDKNNTHLEREFEVSLLETDGELPVPREAVTAT